MSVTAKIVCPSIDAQSHPHAGKARVTRKSHLEGAHSDTKIEDRLKDLANIENGVGRLKLNVHVSGEDGMCDRWPPASHTGCHFHFLLLQYSTSFRYVSYIHFIQAKNYMCFPTL